jgi:hypothetical protein
MATEQSALTEDELGAVERASAEAEEENRRVQQANFSAIAASLNGVHRKSRSARPESRTGRSGTAAQYRI